MSNLLFQYFHYHGTTFPDLFFGNNKGRCQSHGIVTKKKPVCYYTFCYTTVDGLF